MTANNSKAANTATPSGDDAIPLVDASRTDDSAAAPAPSTPQLVPFLDLFRYADGRDRAMMAVGLVGAAAYGCIQPLFSVMIGSMSQPFLDYELARQSARAAAAGSIDLDLELAKSKLRNDLMPAIWLFVGLGFASLVASYLMQSMWTYSGERQARRLRRLFLASALRQDMAWFDKHSPGSLTTQLTSDAILFQEGTSEKVGIALSAMVQFASGVIIALITSWKITLAILACVPFVFASAIKVNGLTATTAMAAQASYREAGALAQEALANIRVVAMFGGLQRARAAFNRLVDAPTRLSERTAWFGGLGFGIFHGASNIIYSIGFIFGAYLVRDGAMTGGQVIQTIFALMNGVWAIVGLSPNLQAIAKARGTAVQLFAIIENQPTVVDGHLAPVKLAGRIEFRDVTFAYPSRPDVTVLNGFNLVAEPGQTIALVGPTGSAKSTCFQLLLRFYDACGGCITIDGVPIKDLSLKWLRQHIGIVSQDAALFDATIAENVAYGAAEGQTVTQADIERACRAANAHDFIMQLPRGYDTLVGEGSSLISGGQRQRIAIARALIKDPTILLLDESTAALDAASEAVVQAALDEAAKGRTTIVIAHRLATIRNASRIHAVSAGRVVESGTHAELVARNGMYADLVAAQNIKRTEPVPVDSTPDVVPTAANPAKATATAVTIAAAAETPKKTKLELLADLEAEAKAAEDAQLLLSQRSIPWTRVAQLQAPEWWLVAIGIVTGTATGLGMPFVGLLIGEALSAYTLPVADGSMLREATKWGFVYVAIGVATLLLTTVQYGTLGVAGERLTRRVRQTMFASMLRQDAAWYDAPQHGTGVLTTVLTEDADRVQSLVGPTLAHLLRLAVSIVASVAIAFVTSWQMALVVMCTMPVIAAGSYFQARVFLGAAGRHRMAYATAAQGACDAMANLATVKAHTREQDVVDAYLRSIDKPYRAGIHAAVVGSLGYAFAQATSFWNFPVCYFAGSLFVTSGAVEVPAMLNTLWVLMMGSQAFVQAVAFGPDVQRAKLALLRYLDMVDATPSIEGDECTRDGVRPVDVAGDAKLDRVEFAYPTRPDAKVLRGLELAIRAGQRVGIVGGSGGGKSSVLALLLRQYDVTSGSVSVEGADVRAWHLPSLRRNMAVVSQSPHLLGTLAPTIGDNIAYGLPDDDARRRDPATLQAAIEAAAKVAQIHDFIAQLPQGYATPVTSSQLSGGQKQRIAIARAVVRGDQIKLLLLDEITAALDAASERAVQMALEAAAVGRTTIIVAHRLATIQNCDVIATVSAGQVVQLGTHDELVRDSSGLYARMVEQQRLDGPVSVE
ncbi:hypothetical protein H9P43_002200 [Blastocladiella emersonii ATCC 22665]|nr:hypothetical protein H9P43_002200 [Blastocladiella emersonii ATCC 22665]